MENQMIIILEHKSTHQFSAVLKIAHTEKEKFAKIGEPYNDNNSGEIDGYMKAVSYNNLTPKL